MQSPHHALAIAIVDSNVLSALGLQQILSDMMPAIETRIFISFNELANCGETFVHHFVSSRIYFEHTLHFRNLRTIVLVQGNMQIQGIPTLNVCLNEKNIIQSIMALHRQGHPGKEHLAKTESNTSPLSPREAEVAVLLAKGLLNKEIADRLYISTTTVITHRKNIANKLHARSLADIIIHVIMSGLAEVGEL